MKKPHKWLKIRGFWTFSFEEVQTPVTKSQSRRFQLRYTPMVILMWSPLWSNIWSADLRTG